MDPDATLKDLLDALLAGDQQQVILLAEALRHWIDSEGFPPLTIGTRELGEDWHSAVIWALCDIAEGHLPTKVEWNAKS